MMCLGGCYRFGGSTVPSRMRRFSGNGGRSDGTCGFVCCGAGGCVGLVGILEPHLIGHVRNSRQGRTTEYRERVIGGPE